MIGMKCKINRNNLPFIVDTYFVDGEILSEPFIYQSVPQVVVKIFEECYSIQISALII